MRLLFSLLQYPQRSQGYPLVGFTVGAVFHPHFVSAGIDESIEKGRAESLAEALRSAEMELFKIAIS